MDKIIIEWTEMELHPNNLHRRWPMFSRSLKSLVHCFRECRCPPSFASHKSNPSSILQVIVDSYSTLPWVTWEAATFVEGIP